MVNNMNREEIGKNPYWPSNNLKSLWYENLHKSTKRTPKLSFGIKFFVKGDYIK